MSDEFYREQATRRARIWWLMGSLVISIICLYAGFVSLFRDDCSKSYNRSPEAVISAYMDAIKRGDIEHAQACWEHEAYYELESGCSEMCLSRASGMQFSVENIKIADPITTPDGRANILLSVMVNCAENGEAFTGEITLDGVGQDIPWRHWKIISSTFGGTAVEAWCQ